MASQQPHALTSYLPQPDAEGHVDGNLIFDRFFAWVRESRGIEPWEHQEDAVLSLAAGDHVILSTPTGSGKSLVALGMHFIALALGERSFYTAPIKALVSEKFFDLIDVFGRDNVGMITGDTVINHDAPIICCTAEILAHEALREGARADIGFVAMDEFHYYGDAARGWAWQVPLLTLPNTHFLLMSATLGNVDAIARNLERMTSRAVEVIDDAPRPVPLEYQYSDKPLPALIEVLIRREQTPIYVVHFSQDAALETAQALANSGVSSREQRERIAAAMKGTKFNTGFGKILQRLLRTGVGVHHAGMLPRYRRLVEQLAQQGLLPVICGTDTLGVGINVPIHSVILTQLTKFDGEHMRRLRSREFHQIAGRAGRMGFDTEGLVIAQAPEFEIENARLIAKAAGDPKKLKKLHKKKPPEGFVPWSEQTFTRLIEAEPEALTPHLTVTHAMILNEVAQGGAADDRVMRLIDSSAQPIEEQSSLRARAQELFDTLIDAGFIECDEPSERAMSSERAAQGAQGERSHAATLAEDESDEDYAGVAMWLSADMPQDFALDQPLSPFLVAAMELLDPQSDTYALDVLSLVESTLDDPRPILKAQQRQARNKAMEQMKLDGVDYNERMDRLQDVTYPRPLERMLDAAFAQYSEDVPWARDYMIHPKSIVRDMVETASDFNSYINRYGLARSEGVLLRYLSDAYRTLHHTIDPGQYNEQLSDIVAWLKVIVKATDSSLFDEWDMASKQTGTELEALQAKAPLGAQVVEDRRGLTVLVRNALFQRVQLMDLDDPQALGSLDADWGFGVHEWEHALDDFYDEHEYVNTDARARGKEFFQLDTSRELTEHTWLARQIIDDDQGDHDWAIRAVVDLVATQASGHVQFLDYRVDNHADEGR